jgi:hypothetical protein
MRAKITDLGIVAVLAAAALLISVLSDIAALRVASGIALALILPGYAFTAALFRPGTLDAPLRALLTFGMSVIFAILGGLALNLTPFGLQATSWSLLLGILTLVEVGVALERGHTISLATLTPAGLRPAHVLLLCCAFVFVAAVGAISSIGALNQYSGSSAQLWMQPGTVVNGQQTVTLGVDNLESTPIQATIVVTLGSTMVQQPITLTLDAGAHWQSSVTIPHIDGVTPELLEAQLTGTGISTSLTRHVSLWVAPKSAPLTPVPTILDTITP